MAFLLLKPLWNSQTDDCLTELMMMHIHLALKGLERSIISWPIDCDKEVELVV